VVAHRLQRGASGERQRRSLEEREVRRLAGGVLLLHRDKLGQAAALHLDHDLVAHGEPRDGGAGLHDDARDVRAHHRVLRAAQAVREARGVRRPAEQVPVGGVEAARLDAHEDLVRGGGRGGEVALHERVGRAVRILGPGLHEPFS